MTESEESVGDREGTIRQQAWHQAIFTFGTAHIFERRSRILRSRLQILTFLGVGVPVAVGGGIMVTGTGKPYLPLVFAVAGLLGVAQLVGSTWALVKGWSDGLAYSVESSWINHALSSRFQDLGLDPPESLEELRRQFALLQIENRQRELLDYQKGITEKEKHRGHRAALRRFSKPCITCEKIPESMEPSDCPTCGTF